MDYCCRFVVVEQIQYHAQQAPQNSRLGRKGLSNFHPRGPKHGLPPSGFYPKVTLSSSGGCCGGPDTKKGQLSCTHLRDVASRAAPPLFHAPRRQPVGRRARRLLPPDAAVPQEGGHPRPALEPLQHPGLEAEQPPAASNLLLDSARQRREKLRHVATAATAAAASPRPLLRPARVCVSVVAVAISRSFLRRRRRRRGDGRRGRRFLCPRFFGDGRQPRVAPKDSPHLVGVAEAQGVDEEGLDVPRRHRLHIVPAIGDRSAIGRQAGRSVPARIRTSRDERLRADRNATTTVALYF